MEPTRANCCFAREPSGTYDGFLDLSDPFLDLNQALGFSLASPSNGSDSESPTVVFESGQTVMGLSTQHDGVPANRRLIDPDFKDKELLGLRHGTSTTACVPQFRCRYETTAQNSCATSSMVSVETSDRDIKAPHG